MAGHTYSAAKHGSHTIGGTRFTVKDFQCKNGNDTVLVDTNLAVLLAAIERHFGAQVTINSAYRDASYNASVGGASGSYHTKGQAADITVSGFGIYEIARYADYKLGGKGGIGCYTGSGFVHVDTRGYASYWESTAWRQNPYQGNTADDPPLDLTVDNAEDMRYTDFPRYTLSESAISDIATMITGETGGEDVTACRQEASQLANLNEVVRGRSNTEANLLKTLHDGWYASASWNRGVTQTAMSAVRFVLVDGKRVLPRYVTEHDTFPGDIKDALERSAYVPHQTKVKNVYGAEYVFYCFFGTNQNLDIAGYLQKDYNKYKDDVPWSEQTSEVGFGDKITYFTNTNEVIPIHPTLFQMPEMRIDQSLAVYVGNRNVTASVGKITISGSWKELAVMVKFESADSDARFTSLYTPKLGDIVRLYTPDEVFRGVIVSQNQNERHHTAYTAADIGWYLNKNKDTYQFSDMDAAEAIKKICGDLGIPIVFLDEKYMACVRISGVYIEQTISEILWDILDKAGGAWNFDFVPKGIRIYRIGRNRAVPKFRVSENTMLHDSVKYRSFEEKSGTIENMKNAVKVISDTSVLAKARNDESYQSFGLLQEIVKIDPDEEDAATTASSKLSELNLTEWTYSFEMQEQLNEYTRSGDVLYVENTPYLVDNIKRTISKGRSRTVLDLIQLSME